MSDLKTLNHETFREPVHTGLFINNEFKVSKETIKVMNPANGKVLVEVSEADSSAVESAVSAAEEGFKVWRSIAPPDRGKILWRLADLMERDGKYLAELESIDAGKPLADVQVVDLHNAIACLRYYAGWCDKISGKTIEGMRNQLFTYTKVEPIGVIGAIVPWNFPLMIACWKLGPALAAGNAVVLKPSEWTPLSVLAVAALAREAGLPAGVLNVIPGYGISCGAAIAGHPRIHKVSFTGSTRTGRAIMKAAADSNLKKVGLELGGKSPIVIFDDAPDLEQAVKWAHMGLFFNMGQCCCATSRIFVQEGVYKRFLDRFVSLVEKARLGDPLDTTKNQGPQISESHMQSILGYIQIGKEEGATLLTGGERASELGDGYYIKPTVFADCTDGMKIVKEEIFGPVVVILPFKTADEAIQRANDSEYGLAGAVFTSNINTALRFVNDIQSGTFWVNCCNMTAPHTPFGGYKTSGNSRDLGEYALSEFSQVKTVMINMTQTL